MLARACSNQLDQLLAEVAALEHAEERIGRALQTLRDGLAIVQLLLRDERAEFLQRAGPNVHMFGDDETLHEQTLRQNQRGVLERNRFAVIAGDKAAYGDAAMGVHPRERGI